jgi:uncharacterized protein YerC
MNNQQKQNDFLRRVNQQSGVVKNDLTTECWEWKGTPDREGYGRIQTKWGIHMGGYAHRVSFQLFVGPIVKGTINHRCDNPICVRPEHLYDGTMEENMNDRDTRGRHAKLRGTKHGSSIFTDDDLNAIREMRKQGSTYVEIASHYDCNRRTIERLCKGTTYEQTETQPDVITHKQKKLTAEQIAEIKSDPRTYKVISEDKKISPSIISKIKNDKY